MEPLDLRSDPPHAPPLGGAPGASRAPRRSAPGAQQPGAAPPGDPPDDDAPLQRLGAGCGAALDAGDLLALLLAPGGGRGRASAERLLRCFGTLRRLSSATPAEIQAGTALPAAAAVRLAAAFALGRSVHAERLRVGATLKASREIFEAYHSRMRDLKKDGWAAQLPSSRPERGGSRGRW